MNHRTKAEYDHRRHSGLSGRRLRVVALLFAWLLATGAQWDLLQVIAWTRMMIENAQSVSMEAAVYRTFAPEGMCSVCRLVETAKHGQDGAPGLVGGLVEKAPLVIQSTSGLVITRPGATTRPQPVIRIPAARRDVPAVPPPRVA